MSRFIRILVLTLLLAAVVFFGFRTSVQMDREQQEMAQQQEKISKPEIVAEKPIEQIPADAPGKTEESDNEAGQADAAGELPSQDDAQTKDTQTRDEDASDDVEGAADDEDQVAPGTTSDEKTSASNDDKSTQSADRADENKAVAD